MSNRQTKEMLVNTLRIAVIAACSVIAVTEYFAQTREVAEATTPPTAIVQVAAPAVLGSNDEPVALSAAQIQTESLPASDTTELLLPPQTLAEVLDAFNADLGSEGVAVDRDELAAMLRADPELAKSILD